MPEPTPLDAPEGPAGEQFTFDTSVANAARVYDYLLGGKDNFAADREAGNRVLAALPGVVQAARGNRAFLGRTVRYLVTEEGIRQFLDIGTGIPTAGNTHEVAQSIAPDCRVVYADHDPVVITHARALLNSRPEGRTAYAQADLREPGKILAAAADTLDFTQPVAVMLVAVLHFVGDEEAYGNVAELMAATAPGSLLVISHVAKDIEPEAVGKAAAESNKLMAQQATPRTRDEVTRFFDGLDLVEPGVVALNEWRPDSELMARKRVVGWGGVARKRHPPANSR